MEADAPQTTHYPAFLRVKIQPDLLEYEEFT